MIAETHFTTPEEIMALADRELSFERGQSVSAHIADCAECQEFATILRGSSLSLSSWTLPSGDVDADFAQRLAEAATKVSSRRQWTPMARWFLAIRWRWAAGAAALALAVSMAIVALNFYRLEGKLDPRPMATFGRNIGSVTESRPVATPQESGASGDKTEQDSVVAVRRLEAQRSELIGLLERSRLSSNLENSREMATIPLFPSAEQEPQVQAEVQPMIARTISLSVIVKDFAASRAAVDAVVAHHHGYAATLAASTQQNAARSLQASLRIPARELNAAAAELKNLGQVENENQNAEEVTQQHTDLVARLKNSRETEQRLQAILVQRTGKISDVLSVEQEIARVRGEIEQMEGEQKSLEHRVDFATIDLNLAEEYKAKIGGSTSPSIATRFHNSVVSGWRAAVESVVSVVLFIVEDGPVALLWLLVLVPLVWFVRRRWVAASTLVS
jgi:hypothetical protein